MQKGVSIKCWVKGNDQNDLLWKKRPHAHRKNKGSGQREEQKVWMWDLNIKEETLQGHVNFHAEIRGE